MKKSILNLSILFILLARATDGQALRALPSNFELGRYVKVGDNLYHFGRSKVDWFIAYLMCRSMGSFLAAFETRDELNRLSTFMAARSANKRWWWISGSDLGSEGDFYWYSTGQRFSFGDWSGNQPDNAGGREHCVHLWYDWVDKRYKMNDWECIQKAYYICEAEFIEIKKS